MTFLEVAVFLSARLEAGFTALPLFADPAVNFTPPAAGCVTLSFDFGEESGLSTPGGGNQLFGGFASMNFAILVPRGEGDGLAWQYLDQISAIYRGYSSSDLTVRKIRPERIPQIPDGKHHQLNLIITFEKTTSYPIAV